MTTAEIMFAAVVVTLLLIWIAWMFASRDNRLMQFWVDLTGRRIGRPPSTKIDGDGDRRSGAS